MRVPHCARYRTDDCAYVWMRREHCVFFVQVLFFPMSQTCQRGTCKPLRSNSAAQSNYRKPNKMLILLFLLLVSFFALVEPSCINIPPSERLPTPQSCDITIDQIYAQARTIGVSEFTTFSRTVPPGRQDYMRVPNWWFPPDSDIQYPSTVCVVSIDLHPNYRRSITQLRRVADAAAAIRDSCVKMGAVGNAFLRGIDIRLHGVYLPGPGVTDLAAMVNRASERPLRLDLWNHTAHSEVSTE